ncbi:AAA family ATPase, partial [Streptomyces sp. SID8455]|nr:AAA family ATPase [Streptomyces sp. SID8455]
SRPYLGYVADVLPSLGEEGVRTCTLRDLVEEGATAAAETDPEVARLKASAGLVKAVEAAVSFYEEPPTESLTLTTPWSEVRLSAADWAVAFEAAGPGAVHNDARDQVREELLTLLVEKHDGESVPLDLLRKALEQDRELAAAFDRAWPLLDAAELVGDLWSVPAYLRMAAPWLTRDEVRLLQRSDAQAWTVADLPVLDAARQRVGDPEAWRRRRRQEAAVAAERAGMAQVIDSLLADETLADADVDSEGALVMLHGQ